MSFQYNGPVATAERFVTVPGLASASIATQQANIQDLPKGFPVKLETKAAWVGSDFKESQNYIYELTSDDKAELSQGLDHFKGNISLSFFLHSSHLLMFPFIDRLLTVQSHPLVLDLQLSGERVSRDTFPLYQLGKKLDKLSAEVHEGRGFCLIRGVKPEDFSVEDLTLVYLAVQTHIADQRAHQDNRGNMLSKSFEIHAQNLDSICAG